MPRTSLLHGGRDELRADVALAEEFLVHAAHGVKLAAQGWASASWAAAVCLVQAPNGGRTGSFTAMLGNRPDGLPLKLLDRTTILLHPCQISVSGCRDPCDVTVVLEVGQLHAKTNGIATRTK